LAGGAFGEMPTYNNVSPPIEWQPDTSIWAGTCLKYQP